MVEQPCWRGFLSTITWAVSFLSFYKKDIDPWKFMICKRQKKKHFFQLSLSNTQQSLPKLQQVKPIGAKSPLCFHITLSKCFASMAPTPTRVTPAGWRRRGGVWWPSGSPRRRLCGLWPLGARSCGSSGCWSAGRNTGAAWQTRAPPVKCKRSCHTLSLLNLTGSNEARWIFLLFRCLDTWRIIQNVYSSSW